MNDRDSDATRGALERKLCEVQQQLAEFESARQEWKKTEDRLTEIGEGFFDFGTDPLENINRLTGLCGRLLKASAALYNRIDRDMLCSWGTWNTPADYNPVDKPQGHICYDIIKEGSDQVVIVDNLLETSYAETDPNVRAYNLQTYVGRAVKFGDAYVGSLCMVYHGKVIPSEWDKRLINFIASAIAVEEKRKAAEEEAERRRQSLTRLLTASQVITVTTDPRKLFRLIISTAKDLLALDFSTLMIFSSDGKSLVLQDSLGFPDSMIGSFRLIEGEGLSTLVVKTRKPDVVHNYRSETRFAVSSVMMENGINSAIAVPMILEGEVFGVLVGHTLAQREFTKDEISLYQGIGNQAAVAIKNSMNILALKESEEKYRDLFENANDAIFIIDSNLRYLDMNKKALDMLGYSREELLTMNTLDIIPKEQVPRSKREFEKLRETGNYEKFIGKVRTKDGRWIDIEVSSSAIVRGGAVVGSRDIVRDITERKRMEEELIRAQKLESVSVLAGGIAHDFNNILTGILGNITLAKIYGKPGDTWYERLDEAERASLRARDLTQQLLTFSRGGKPVKRLTTLGKLLRDSAGFALRGSDIGCEFSIPDDLWPVEVDEGQMSQVMHNLIINACQAMPKGGRIRLEAENVEEGHGEAVPLGRGRYIRISVTDRGGGIPRDYLERIFDPYFTTKEKGSGLGLSITYSIIKNHGGFITVESEVGVGTTFYVYLPSSEGHAHPEDVKEEKMFAGKGRILVMDDEEMVRTVAAGMLNFLGYEVETARHGAEAVALYEKAGESGRPFDVVIMDLTIAGGMGGKEAAERLIGMDPAVKVIVSSGYSDDPVMSDFRSYGFKAVMKKPYKMQDLSKTIRNAMSAEPPSEHPAH
ncbi:MAG TPA: PAS domain S-box protein [Thermodesulfovibrionales bacterium]|nr:PAS domain S-box protein [Thermodesulfovibrionales bacterium]